MPANLVAAVAWHEPDRLGLVQRDGEAHTTEHLLGDLLGGFHLCLAISGLQTVGLVEHRINLFLALLTLQILLELSLLLAKTVISALILVADTAHRLHSHTIRRTDHVNPFNRVSVAGQFWLAKLVLRL